MGFVMARPSRFMNILVAPTHLFALRAFLFFLVALQPAAFSLNSAETANENTAASRANDFVKDVRRLVKQLGYPEELGHVLVEKISDWHCAEWKTAVFEARSKLRSNGISSLEAERQEEAILRRLRNHIKTTFAAREVNGGSSNDLTMVLGGKQSLCFGNCQLVYILGISLGFEVRFVSVIEPSATTEPSNTGHIANIVTLSDRRTIMLDVSDLISAPFNLEDQFINDGKTSRLKNVANPLGIHRTIQIWDESQVASCIHFYRGVDLDLSGRTADALLEYSRAIELNSRYADAYLFRGGARAKSGKFEDALSDYSKTIEINPASAQPYYYRGSIYSRLGKTAEAFHDFSEALKRNARYLEVYLYLGSLKYEKNNSAEAIKDYNMAIAIDPQCSEAYYLRGLAHDRLGETHKSLRDLSKAIDLGTAKADVYYAMGLALFKSGDREKHFSEVIANMEKAIKLNSQYADAYSVRGNAHYELGDVEKAIADYTKAVECCPKNPVYYFERASAYLALEKVSAAVISDFDRAIQLDPKFSAAYANRGWTYYRLNRSEEALRDLDKAIELSPNIALNHKCRAAILLNLGRTEDAMRELRQACKLDNSLREEIDEIAAKHGLGDVIGNAASKREK
jgi:tetratricopeptide (TPR) repeat protein